MKGKIFLIDDQEIVNFVHKRFLKLIDADLEAVDFKDSKEAIKALNEMKPELIFLDLNMPGLNGWDVLDFMKNEEIRIPVVILTSSNSLADRAKAANYPNVLTFEQKPMQKSNFESILHKLESVGPHEIKN